jgi:hypothetical protein
VEIQANQSRELVGCLPPINRRDPPALGTSFLGIDPAKREPGE